MVLFTLHPNLNGGGGGGIDLVYEVAVQRFVSLLVLRGFADGGFAAALRLQPAILWDHYSK